MTKSSSKTFMFLRTISNGMVSDHFYMTENYETKIMDDFQKSESEKTMIMERKGKTEICLFFRDKDFAFCLGQSVKLKKEFCETEAEAWNRYAIVEIDERQKRIKIECITTSMAIKPCETVSMDMVEKA